jgi:hypothetical protein
VPDIIDAIDSRIDRRVKDPFIEGVIVNVGPQLCRVRPRNSQTSYEAYYQPGVGVETNKSCLIAWVKERGKYVVVTVFSVPGSPSYSSKPATSYEFAPPSNIRILTTIPGHLVVAWDVPPQQPATFEVQTNTSAADAGATTVAVTRGAYAIVAAAASTYARVRSVSDAFEYSTWSDWYSATPSASYSLTVTETDGSPSIPASTLRFPNASVANPSAGVAAITFPASLTIKEIDGAPSVAGVSEIRVANGTLTDIGSGVVELATGGGGGDPTGLVEATKEELYTEKVIYDVTLGANGSFENIAIPSGYDHLEMFASLRSSQAATADGVYLYFNGDFTNANYRYQEVYANGATVSAGVGDVPRCGVATAASVGANEFSNAVYSIENAFVSGKTRSAKAIVTDRDSATVLPARIEMLNWESTAPITSITLRPDGYPTDTFVTGSRLQIIGKKRLEVVTGITGAVMGTPVDSLVLDYVMPASPSTDHVSAVSLTVDTWVDFSNEQSFTIDSPGLVTINVRGSAFARNESGTYTQYGFGVLVDGTDHYDLAGMGGSSTNGSGYSRDSQLLAGINSLTLDLAAGTHTLQFRVYNRQGSSGAVMYCRPNIPSESFAVQVLYHTKQQVASLTVTSESHEVRELIYDETLASSDSFEDIAIPAGYDHLEIVYQLRSTASTIAQEGRLYFNGDATDANYSSEYSVGVNSTPAALQQDSPALRTLTGASSTSGDFGIGHITVPFASQSGIRRTSVATFAERRDATNYEAGVYSINWENTAAITSVTLRTDNHSTDLFAAGSRVQIFGVKTSSVVTEVNGAVVVDTLHKYACFGRLTLTTGVPVTTSDVTAATTLYFTAYKGDQIGLYSAGVWTVRSFSEVSLSLAALNANTNYDIFAYDNTGAVALEALAWTNDTTRATALTTLNGIYVKSGATSRRYLGTIRTVAAGQTEDSLTKRFVWNYYNRAMKELKKAAPGDYTYATSTARYANGDATQRVELVAGLIEDCVKLHNAQRNVGGSAVIVGIERNAVALSDSTNQAVRNGTHEVTLVANYSSYPAVGFNYFARTEWASGTVTFTLSNGSGMQGTWIC